MSAKLAASAAVLVMYGGFGLYHLDNGAVGWAALMLTAITVAGVMIYPHVDVRPQDFKPNPPDY